MTKVMTKSSKINQKIKNNSRVQDKNQEGFKTQDSRMKRRLNQDKY